jgi:predicted transcriptional regulator
MKKTLLDLIFASEKRKNTLLLLQDGAKEMEDLLISLDTTRQALLPQVRMLENYHLVNHHRDTYELTTIGKLVVGEMAPLLNTISIFDENIDYWGTRNFNFIPHHLFRRINDLGKCRVVNPSFSKMYEVCHELHESTKISEHVFTVTTSFYPNFAELSSDLITNNVEAHIIISKDLYEKVRTHKDINILKVMSDDLLHFYVYPKKMDLIAFVHNDYYVLLSPMTNTGEVDNKYILCSGPSALNWAKELYEHYLKEAIPITEF